MDAALLLFARTSHAATRCLTATVGVMAAMGCGPKVPFDPVTMAPPAFNGVGELVDLPPVHWIGPGRSDEAEAWHAAVGPPVLVSTAPPESVVLDSLLVVSWNTHVGGGSVDRFITDLRNGALTDGSPVPHFVLALQEVFREGDAVPSSAPDDARCADAICGRTPRGDRNAVEEIAHRHGLELFYVPSMRNGKLADGRPEDRGNAILSTISLTQLTAVELPMAKQRRVAVAAAVCGETAAGSQWELELINLHLDGFSPLRHFFGSFGRCRTRQLDFLTDALDGDHPAILAGDLNTWFRGANESVIDDARRAFPLPSQIPEEATYRAGVLRRQLDYVFFRLPDEWSADYRRLDDPYGSDHYPLLAWVRFHS